MILNNVKIYQPNNKFQSSDSQQIFIRKEQAHNNFDYSLRDTNSNWDLLKHEVWAGLKWTNSNQTLPYNNNIIGKRRQSPPLKIFGERAKTPLKLLHYHKNKASFWNAQSSKPVVACSLIKYGVKWTSSNTNEDLILSSLASDDEEGKEYLDHELRKLDMNNKFVSQKQMNKNYKNMGSFSTIQNNPKATYLKNSKCEISSPLTYLCDNEGNNFSQEYGNPQFLNAIGSKLQCNKYLDYEAKNKRNGRSKSNSVNNSNQESSRIGSN